MSDTETCPECGTRMGKHHGCEFAADGGLEFAHTPERCLTRQLAKAETKPTWLCVDCAAQWDAALAGLAEMRKDKNDG